MKLIFLLLSLFLILSCSSSKVVKKDINEQEVPKSITALDDFHEDEEEVDITEQKVISKLEYADGAFKIGDFDEAIKTYLEVYNNQSHQDKYRGEALFKLGMTYSNILFENQENETALQYLKLFIKEYPISEFRMEAFNKIQELEIKIEEEKKE
ncbi:MAG: tetratricopeptide repeat protein [Candidatus Cloacimonetes bacterium]|nr:tetratricopeptide repeat protein [Candidatus Cloacimonadota bacterium]